MDGRQARGAQIAAETGAVMGSGHSWRVRSQTTGAKKYRVNPMAQTCTCPDHEDTGLRCKHLYAVQITMTVETDENGTTVTARRVTYAQDWTTYNRCQVNEKDTFVRLLADLCSRVEQPVQMIGRPRLPLSDMAFATTYKVFSGYSSRRFSTDLRDAHERGLITRVPHFNSVSNYMANPDMTPVLRDLITESALPLRALESDFAVDSSGFNSGNVMRWLDTKHGTRSSQAQREWLKAHLMCGVRTNIVTSVEVSNWKGGDTTYFAPLVEATAKEFTMAEVSADKAYTTKANVEKVESVGAVPYIPFKSNTKDPGMIADSAWARMYHRFAADPETFMAAYHKRSNVETTFAMIKARFGAHLRSKSPTGQVNELLCKVLAHNVVVVGNAVAEFGIDGFCATATRAQEGAA